MDRPFPPNLFSPRNGIIEYPLSRVESVCLLINSHPTDTQVLNIATTCCHTFLLGRHSVYDSNCVTTSSDFPTWRNTANVLPFLASSRWFSNQWETERLAQYPPLVGIWVREGDGSITGEQGWEEVFAKHMEGLQREIAEDAPGETFDAIVDSILGRDNSKVIVVSEASK